jgi:hypothetical protein
MLRRRGQRRRHESPVLQRESDTPLLLDPGIGQGLGESGDGEICRRGATDNRHNDARRQEGEGSEQADVPFALDRGRA